MSSQKMTSSNPCNIANLSRGSSSRGFETAIPVSGLGAVSKPLIRCLPFHSGPDPRRFSAEELTIQGVAPAILALFRLFTRNAVAAPP